MKRLSSGMLALLGMGGFLSSALAQTAEPTPVVAPATPVEPAPANDKRAREFQGDDLGQVLRLLGRQAKINLVVGEAVKGMVSARLENASAMEAIEVLAHQYKLSMTRDEKGVCYINPPDATDAALDVATKPETAYKVAAYKRNLYTALIKQGFTPDESLKIVVASDPVGGSATPGKKTDPVSP